MPYFVVVSLFEQSERLCDDLFELAVESQENPRFGDFGKICGVLDHALERLHRRKLKAGLVFLD
jgi:hypothetical protein